MSEALQLDLFMLVKNFLYTTNVVDVHPTTGKPNSPASKKEIHGAPSSPRFKMPEAPEGYPFPVDQILPEFRERFRPQDLDGDGVIALEEAQQVLRRALIASADSPFNYGEPRQVRFGVELRF